MQSSRQRNRAGEDQDRRRGFESTEAARCTSTTWNRATVECTPAGAALRSEPRRGAPRWPWPVRPTPTSSSSAVPATPWLYQDRLPSPGCSTAPPTPSPSVNSLNYIQLYYIVLTYIVLYSIKIYCIILYYIQFNFIQLYCINLYCIKLYCILFN